MWVNCKCCKTELQDRQAWCLVDGPTRWFYCRRECLVSWEAARALQLRREALLADLQRMLASSCSTKHRNQWYDAACELMGEFSDLEKI